MSSIAGPRDSRAVSLRRLRTRSTLSSWLLAPKPLGLSARLKRGVGCRVVVGLGCRVDWAGVGAGLPWLAWVPGCCGAWVLGCLVGRATHLGSSLLRRLRTESTLPS